jgi:hypothetical protein
VAFVSVGVEGSNPSFSAKPDARTNLELRYGEPELKDMARVIEKFPRYEVGPDDQKASS